jgi:DNA-binding NarL/FixJ family response regulator
MLGRSDRDFTPGDRSSALAARAVLDIVSNHAEAREHHVRLVGPGAAPLTEREVVVLQLLEDGLTANGAAARLGISTRTVQKHTERIYRKLGAHDLHTALQAAAQLTILLSPGIGN